MTFLTFMDQVLFLSCGWQKTRQQEETDSMLLEHHPIQITPLAIVHMTVSMNPYQEVILHIGGTGTGTANLI
jgi:hypothetical protein